MNGSTLAVSRYNGVPSSGSDLQTKNRQAESLRGAGGGERLCSSFASHLCDAAPECWLPDHEHPEVLGP